MIRLSTRRDFLATTSRTFAGMSVASNPLRVLRLSSNMARSPETAASLLPEPIADLDLRGLATSAIDVARGAGAEYADVRVAEHYNLSLLMEGEDLLPRIAMQATFTYGVRVLVDGAWAFAHGTVPALNEVAVTTRNAVATARGDARLTTQRVELAAVPPAIGHWETPVEIDPFTVPLRDQSALLWAYRQAAARVRNAFAEEHTEFNWSRETRVFASSEGALCTQTFRTSRPFIQVYGNVGLGDWGQGPVTLRVPHMSAAAAGYEHVARAGLQDDLVMLAEEAVRLAGLPRRPLDVGRYPVILDGITLGAIFARTISPALEWDRVLGHETDASGTSYLSPPEATLGTSVTSPLLTANGDRALPSVLAARWDDDGVEPQTYPIITSGTLVNYHTSRIATSGARVSSAHSKVATQPHGCAIAPEAGFPVTVRAPHITIAPTSTTTALEDLCRGVGRGVLVRNAVHLMTDQQLASGALYYSYRSVMLEIERGKITRRINGNGLQFNTATFWKSLQSLGDASTVDDVVVQNEKGQPWHPVANHVTAPAGLFKDVNVISTTSRQG